MEPDHADVDLVRKDARSVAVAGDIAVPLPYSCLFTSSTAGSKTAGSKSGARTTESTGPKISS